MQNFLGKIFTLLVLLLSSLHLSADVSIGEQINMADEAFSKGNYSEAFNGYDQLVKNERVVSESMLNKLVWMSGKNKDSEQKLLYTSMLYRFFPDEKSKEKIIKKNSEDGVDLFFTDLDTWFYLWWNENMFWFIVPFFIGLLISGSFYMVLLKLNKESKNVAIYFSLVCSVLLLCCYLVPFLVKKPVSYISSGEEEFYKESSYASEVSHQEVKKNELLKVIRDSGPWLQLKKGTDTLYLAKNERPFIF